MGAEAQGQPLLAVRGLQTWLYTSRGVVHAVDDVDLTVAAGESVGLVGESGCGKTMMARSIMQLVPQPPARIVGGKVILDNRDLLTMNEEEMEQIRGREIAMVFQDPQTYLNPTMRIGDQVGEAVWLHQGRDRDRVWQAVGETLDRVGLPSDAAFRRRYPHELSGGMRQRVLIAIALACRPKVLIADEPTTALDVTLQAQILDLLRRLQRELHLGLLLITHDVGIVAELCDRVYVMYGGQVVEEATTVELFERPQHPYTQALLAGALSIEEFRPELRPIEGSVPDLLDPGPGCRFRPRCRQAFPACSEDPSLVDSAGGGKVRCWMYARSEEGRTADGR